MDENDESVPNEYIVLRALASLVTRHALSDKR